MVTTPICERCGQGEENILHLFYDCNYSREIWNYTQEILKHITNENIILDKNKILFGFNNDDCINYKGINTILMRIKNFFIQIERPTLANSRNLIIHCIKEIVKIEKTFLSEKHFKRKWRNIENLLNVNFT